MENDILLGTQQAYPESYNPKLLHGVSRQEARNVLLKEGELPFAGVDIWTAYELSWLDTGGKPNCAIGVFYFPSESRAIVESKSFKYYLNSFNQTKFSDADQVSATFERDLSQCAGGAVRVELHGVDRLPAVEPMSWVCLDSCEMTEVVYEPSPRVLTSDNSLQVTEVLYSHLLKSNCPVTGQPDWASIWFSYKGGKIDHASLLTYIVSYRSHQGFHENCVERIFLDILRACQPVELSVYARYTRRGGLDINPFRTNCGANPPNIRSARQ